MDVAQKARVPGAGELALIALCLLTAALFTLRTDDLYWLAEVGRSILREHALPTGNRYSFTAPDHPWQTHEWLSEVLVALPGDSLLFAAGLLLCWVPVALVLRVSASAPAIGGAAVLAIETGLAGMFVRPYLLGRALLAIVLALRKPLKPWLALLLFAFWANVHGSFGYGLFVLVIRVVREHH